MPRRARESAHSSDAEPLSSHFASRRWFLPFAEPDIHSLSRARRPSQKIECVFSASPETVRRKPREFDLPRSVGQWRDLAVCFAGDPGDTRPSCEQPQASLDWSFRSLSLSHRATQDRDPVWEPTSLPRSAQIGYSCCAVWKSACESTSRLSFFRHRRARNN